MALSAGTWAAERCTARRPSWLLLAPCRRASTAWAGLQRQLRQVNERRTDWTLPSLLNIHDLDPPLAFVRLYRVHLPAQLGPRPKLPLRLGRLGLHEPLPPVRRFDLNLSIRWIGAVIEVEQRGEGTDRERAPDRVGVGQLGEQGGTASL